MRGKPPKLGDALRAPGVLTNEVGKTFKGMNWLRKRK